MQHRFIEPRKYIHQGATVQDSKIVPRVFSFTYPLPDHKFIEPKKFVDTVAPPAQTYIFPIKTFENVEAKRRNDFIPIPIVDRFDGATKQDSLITPKVFSFTYPLPDHKFIPPYKANDTITQPAQTYIFHPFIFNNDQFYINNNFIPIPVKPRAERGASQQTYVFHPFIYDYTDFYIKSHKFITPIKSQLLITTATPPSTGFWCADTGMSGMTGGGDINQLGGY